MSKLFDDTMHGLMEAISIEKGEIPMVQRENMPAPTFVVGDSERYAKDSRLTETSDAI